MEFTSVLAYTDNLLAVATGDPTNFLLTLHLYLHHITQQLPEMTCVYVYVCVHVCVHVCGRGNSQHILYMHVVSIPYTVTSVFGLETFKFS